MQYVNLAVKAYMEKSKDHTGDATLLTGSGKRDSSGLLKSQASDLSYSIPFGPHLIPVTCACQKDTGYKDPSLSQTIPAHLKCEGDPGCDGELPESSGLGSNQEAGSSWTSNVPEAGVHISTNDMLECLVHPDVITLITRLLMNRQRELHRY